VNTSITSASLLLGGFPTAADANTSTINSILQYVAVALGATVDLSQVAVSYYGTFDFYVDSGVNSTAQYENLALQVLGALQFETPVVDIQHSALGGNVTGTAAYSSTLTLNNAIDASKASLIGAILAGNNIDFHSAALVWTFGGIAIEFYYQVPTAGVTLVGTTLTSPQFGLNLTSWLQTNINPSIRSVTPATGLSAPVIVASPPPPASLQQQGPPSTGGNTLGGTNMFVMVFIQLAAATGVIVLCVVFVLGIPAGFKRRKHMIGAHKKQATAHKTSYSYEM